MKAMPRWSFSTMIASFVHCFLICTSLIAGATIKPTNPGRTIRKDNGNPTGKGPSSPSPPVVAATQPPTKPPTPAPSPAPTYKPTNPPRKPTKSAAEIAAEALANSVLAALQPLFTAVGTKNLGCPYAAEDLRRGIFDTTKYQGKAAMYVYSLMQSGMDLTSGSSLLLYYVLACFYHATGGPNWIDSTDWLSTTSPPCDWEGVSCDRDDYFEALNLRENGLKGVVPCEIVLLSKIYEEDGEIQLSHNPYLNTAGSAGPQWIAGLGRGFEYLEISSTLFGASFPSNLRNNIPNLQHFGASNASVTGDLSFLVGLDPIEIFLSDNNIHGTIPPALLAGTNLRQFHVANNQLRGKVPTELGNLPSGPELFQLSLNGNQLTGSIVSNVPSALFLNFLVFDNMLTGSIPDGYCSIVTGQIGIDCSEVTCPSGCSTKCCCTRSACEPE